MTGRPPRSRSITPLLWVAGGDEDPPLPHVRTNDVNRALAMMHGGTAVVVGEPGVTQQVLLALGLSPAAARAKVLEEA